MINPEIISRLSQRDSAQRPAGQRLLRHPSSHLVVSALVEGADPEHTTVAEAVGEDLVTVSVDREVDQAAGVMREHSVRRLPVVDADGTPVGVVSLGDLAALAAEEVPGVWHSRIVAPTPDLHQEPGAG